MSQVGHAVAGALEVSLHAAAVSDCLQGAQAGSGGQIRHAVPQLLLTLGKFEQLCTGALQGPPGGSCARGPETAAVLLPVVGGGGGKAPG